ncbi:MAG TPA: aminotransferase class I/II-fold pyridoxal phosphate-dependent enzyme [Candidatus Nitrosotenuis sp.]|jgi:aspartate aminotransferase|nr:aminotransferase class I/II-fold pyridoxal phosphate-dependent enzyme [Candidatus Nitrosotenuis sp.]
MPRPRLSDHLQERQPSDIRLAGIHFAHRQDACRAINVAVGNVSLPMHPAMTERMKGLGGPSSPFRQGVVPYTPTGGTDEARQAFLHVIAASGFSIEGLHCQITDGGSQAMELLILATCGKVEGQERPLLLIDAAYTNYKAFAARLGIPTVSLARTLHEHGKFSLPPLDEIETLVRRARPGALVVIPYDNPTGHFYDRATLRELARLCVEHNLWMISDEAYRELHYVDQPASSIWALSEAEVPGIHGRRVSIETASKVWNACGLRIGAIVTDNLELHTQCVAENTAGLCSSALGQYIFGALAHLPREELRAWFERQRSYYRGMMSVFRQSMLAELPGVIVSSPDAALYSVLDVRRICAEDFDARDFVLWCAGEGAVQAEDGPWTVLVAPMAGFYSVEKGRPNPGRTQMRVAFVEPPEVMARVPALLADLFRQYQARRPAAAQKSVQPR